MKIAYINQLGADIRTPPFNGPANHIRQVAKELTALGHQLKILVGLDGQVWVTEDLENFRILQTSPSGNQIFRLFERVIRRIQSQFHLPYFAWFESYHFSQICLDELTDTDIILERISWMGYGAAMASKKLDIPLIVEFNGDPLHDLIAKKQAPTGLQKKISIDKYRFSLSRATKIISSGLGWQNNLIEKWQVNPDKIITIENGTSLLNQLQRKDLKSFQFPGNPEQEIRIVYLGGFYSWHGTNLLINAFQKNFSEFPNLRLIMIGAGDGFPEAQSLVKQLKLEDVIFFSGQLSSEQFAPLLANADIAVSPYCGWVEFSGLKLFDYKAAGLAIIASGENGHPISLIHGETGWIVPPCDQEALIESLRLLVLDQDLRIKLGQNGRVDAEKNNTWEKTANEIEKQLLGALSNQVKRK
jgi:glycosyltransferase involved in cell wall biosynthesis